MTRKIPKETRQCIDCPETFLTPIWSKTTRCRQCAKQHAAAIYREKHREELREKWRQGRYHKKGQLSEVESFIERTDRRAHHQPYPWIDLYAWILKPEGLELKELLT